ncbi:multidrug transporter AcrB [Vibrio albus]|uniref:Multidrug transporter AcrB n=1 Tax=Vibrio albus TaxID=2200953 RepID=A0A2U3B6I5_9VIBR|nr:efflux RND transporter permease subunit [Vibrio albus]PWI32382.1 multidrug transporter AcrB [Vibrio albus]
MRNNHELGISGRIAKQFLHSPITPLLALIGLLMGIGAVFITPKEEEPQIEVTFADIYIPFPGATPKEVEQLVTLPAEQVLSEMKDIDTMYSFSQPGQAMLIVAFKVGKPRQQALVDLYNQLVSNQDWVPANLGVGQPLVKPRAIDDVPIMNLTLWSKRADITAEQLTQVANGLETELKHLPGTRQIETVGRHDRIVQVTIDPALINAYGLTWMGVTEVLQNANQQHNGLSLTQDNRQISLQVGSFLTSADDVGQLIVSTRNNQPIYLADIAEVKEVADVPSQNVWMSQEGQVFPAVTVSVAKQPGVNAVDLTQAITARIDQVRNVLIPQGVNVTVTRDYGQTASEKANKLISKLIFATTAVVVLVVISMGWREAVVVGGAILLTLAITLFASWVWGFTLNRISLFALIFSIGILVDDAIVVVENIHRHQKDGGNWKEAIPQAVDEVGGPTILATLTVIAALLPMAFVTGMMGPYMSPIPINASTGMLISLAVAFIVTPWLAIHLLKSGKHSEHTPVVKQGRFGRFLGQFLTGTKAKSSRRLLSLVVSVALIGAMALPVVELVVLKMLPFDNKSEFQVMLNMPEGTPVEETQTVLHELATEVEKLPEVTSVQLYAGTSAPINFNGLVRHYFMRQSQELGDLQVNLLGKHERDRASHDIARDARERLAPIAEKAGGVLKVVEIPPGPPVWSPILAEVYGPTQNMREQTALEVQKAFKATADIVDIDVDVPAAQEHWMVTIDRARASRLGIPEAMIRQTIASAIRGSDVSYLHASGRKYAEPIRLRVADGEKVNLLGILSMSIPTAAGTRIPLSELVQIRKGTQPHSIMHKNMQPMIMVTADMAGELDSPLYGMAEISSKLSEEYPQWDQSLINQPDGLSHVALKWDGEWKITYETFRDMGIAYSVGIILIYLLVVMNFNSYSVPLIIMAPIPLTLVGVMPGHALLHAPFTATSMIGMIALAGIIVRNSILLVDFVNQQLAQGVDLAEAVVNSGVVRAKPIILTALAAMIGAMFILDDPIFNGLAISLVFGLFASTLLTLVVIPVLYYLYMRRKMA